MTGAPGWDEVLDDLTAQLDALDALDLLEPHPARAHGADWQPPAHLGPLPDRLAERARALAARQEEQIARLRATLDETLAARRRTGREHEAVRRLGEATRQPAVPVYVDLVG